MPASIPSFDLNQFLPYRFSVAAQAMSQGFARLYRESHGISVAEWRVLAHLAHSGEASVRDVERRVNMEKSKVSRAASRLQAEGYVSKRTDRSDRRLVRLALSEKGQELMAELIPLALSYQKSLECLLGERFGSLCESLDALDALAERGVAERSEGHGERTEGDGNGERTQ